MGVSGALATAALLGSCDSDPLICPAIFYHAVIVEVIDAVDGDPEALGATGRLQDDQVFAGMSPSPDGLYLLADTDRGGTYDVTIHKDGFLEWSTPRVHVEREGCVTHTVNLRARLVPE